jgi:hypothetical protein
MWLVQFLVAVVGLLFLTVVVASTIMLLAVAYLLFKPRARTPGLGSLRLPAGMLLDIRRWDGHGRSNIDVDGHFCPVRWAGGGPARAGVCRVSHVDKGVLYVRPARPGFLTR